MLYDKNEGKFTTRFSLLILERYKKGLISRKLTWYFNNPNRTHMIIRETSG